MRTRSKLVLAGLAATFLMSFAVGTASARNLSVDNSRFRVTFNNLEFNPGFGEPTTCHVTLEGSLHRHTIPKTAGTLLGYITRVQTGNCSPFGVTILTERMPWHISYQGFSGRLPDITLIFIRAEGFFRVGPCLARGPFEGKFSRDPVTRHIILAFIPFQEVAITNREFFCPIETAGFASNGRGQVYLSNSNTRISLTLI